MTTGGPRGRALGVGAFVIGIPNEHIVELAAR